MKLSELIKVATNALELHGDMDVEIPDRGCGCCGYERSDVAETRIDTYEVPNYTKAGASPVDVTVFVIDDRIESK
jgi:O-acetyl-ADP-ribose deacetylase (regulator of RNase III)